jgi:hypothetical protein
VGLDHQGAVPALDAVAPWLTVARYFSSYYYVTFLPHPDVLHPDAGRADGGAAAADGAAAQLRTKTAKRS